MLYNGNVKKYSYTFNIIQFKNNVYLNKTLSL